MSEEHPLVAVFIFFVMLVFAGIIIGYMSVNLPNEIKQVPDMFKQPEPAKSTNVDYIFDNSSSYSTLHRGAIIIDYIPNEVVITNATYTIYVGGGGAGAAGAIRV